MTEFEPAGSVPCEVLEWDSGFFGCQIARVCGNVLTTSGVGRIMEWCKARRIDCLYLLAASNDLLTIELAEKYQFHFVDVRMTFEREVEPISPEPCDNVRPARSSDLEHMKQTARSSFRESRFYFDPGFERSRCDDLYATWIEKSCKGYADFVLVGEEKGQPAGWVTGHVGPGDVGSIGLIAVDADCQGRGLGKRLVAAALRAFQERGVRVATVVTQGRNIRSQRLYQKCGFVTQAVELWYHRWFAVPR